MNNTTTRIPTNCSACGMSLENNSAYRICQIRRERVAASRHRCRAEEQQEDAVVATRPRGRSKRTGEFADAESQARGRPRADSIAYISQFSRLRSLDLGRLDKE
ncbi:hypothetical protein RMATCC62417_01568 [Rhizopus microsporus]|nr:hypothetical protein RMATCC62417_01568 [Rhizopus microsporus]